MSPRKIIRILVGALLCIPAAIVITLLGKPFWGWFESVSDVESLGHSGPATWCYLVVYVAVLVLYCAITLKGPDRDH